MAYSNSNMLLVILAVVVLIAIIYYLNKNDEQPIHNNGTITNNNNNTRNYTNDNVHIPNNQVSSINNQAFNNPNYNNVSDSIFDELVSQYNGQDQKTIYTASDPMTNQFGPFTGYEQKRLINTGRPDLPYNDEYDQRDFVHKKKKFTRRTPDDVKDLFDVDKMLPQEIEHDWFDTEPLQSTKKIKGTHLIHPKIHMGVNTIGSSLKNGTHDIRGDIPNPKINVSPWGNSTIEPDTNLKGLC